MFRDAWQCLVMQHRASFRGAPDSTAQRFPGAWKQHMAQHRPLTPKAMPKRPFARGDA
jgi:hypothetical protein